MVGEVLFDLTRFAEVEDLIYLDQPILTHLRGNGKHWFRYLVDIGEKHDRFLFFEVSKWDIAKYLRAECSLRTILEGTDNFLFEVEIDYMGLVSNTSIIMPGLIPEGYLPAENSFVTYKVQRGSVYEGLLADYEKDEYLRNLRSGAFYIKFASNSKKYRETLGFNEIVKKFLARLASSYDAFLEADYLNSMGEVYSDIGRLKKSFNSIKSDLDYRTVDFKYGSFEIGLAVDTLMKSSIENKAVHDWAVNVGDKYRKIAFSNDYSSRDVKDIVSRYDEPTRRKIFDPVFEIRSNKQVSLEVRQPQSTEYKRMKLPNRTIMDWLAPPVLKEKAKPKDLQLLNVIVLQDKNAPKKTIHLGGNTLFDTSDNYSLKLGADSIRHWGADVTSDWEIEAIISTVDGGAQLSAEYDGQLFVVGEFEQLPEGINKLTKKLAEYIANRTDDNDVEPIDTSK